jgi:two-component system sensor histidine kinase/response regulator
MPAARPLISDQVQEALVRETRERIIREGALAEFSYLLLTAVVAVIAFSTVPQDLLAGWVLVIAIACLARAYLRRRLLTREYTRRERRLTRTATTLLAAAWGVGAGVASRWLSFADLALMLMMLTGMVAGATSTFAADRRAFRYFLAAVVIPLAVGLLTAPGELTHSHVGGLLLIGLFSLLMLITHQRGYTSLVQQAFTNVELAVSQERTAHERARLDALFASAPVATVVVDDAGRVRDVNPRFQELFGYSAGEIVGRPLNDLIVPPAELQRAQQFDATVRSGETLVIEAPRRRKDGRLVPVRASAARVEGADEPGLFVLYEDISEETAARTALQEAKEAAERVAQMRSAFLANTSHEIRTPMNAVLGLAELLLDTDLTPDQRRSLTLIQSSGETLLTLLNDILDLSKIEAESLQLESVPFELPRLVDSTVSLMAVKAREHNIELLADITSSVPEQVRGDPTRLRQVLTNLIGNAIKFTHEGEVVAAVRLVAEESGKATVRFAVRDTGIGIPEEQRETIFQPFSQGDISTTRKYGGTGLGLTIAQRLVQMMGGQLEVKSAVGRGSEFWFSIDLAVDVALPGPVAAPGAVELSGLRMLVVDDNQSNRRVLRGLLFAAGVTVDEAASAAEGLAAMGRAAAAHTPYALAILDALMPERDGYQLAELIRADPSLRPTRLLMLTSAGQRGDAQRCREIGIHGYLTKPVSRADLLDVVAGILGRPEGAPEVMTRHRIAESRRHLAILLAEDNLVNQEVAATMLRKRGHHVDVVGTGKEAVALASHGHYDVVLMDIQMPDLDGLDATRAIRATPSGADLPIVALSAFAQAEERQRCLAAGMNGFVTKPFKAFELFAAAEGWGARTTPAPVDLATFRRDMAEAGAAEAVDGIVESFLASATTRTSTMARAVEEEALPEIARLAHAFRSSAAQLGARRLAEALKEIEAAAKEGAMEPMRKSYAEFVAEADAVVQYLRKEVRK